MSDEAKKKRKPSRKAWLEDHVSGMNYAPRVDNSHSEKVGIDRLLRRLLKEHLVPRYDIAQAELDTVILTL